MLSANQIAICIRPQFVWDHKSTGRWLLADTGRDDYFQKDLGILVFINLGFMYKCPLSQVQSILAIDDHSLRLHCNKLEVVLTWDNLDIELEWQRQQITTKTGLTKNLIYWKYNIKP